MTDEQQQRIKHLLDKVMDLEVTERAAYLDENCDDSAIRAEVESLLQYHIDQTTDLAEDLHLKRRTRASAILAGQTIGNYRILSVLGEGGMGAVYRAEQLTHDGQILREVALKIIQPGAINPTVLRRFEHEATVLARLQHPGIATIYEAGTFDAGSGLQPFFAMELIDGEMLTQYAERRGLGIRERLRLIVKICHAVQHAHQKGIIHRDLKPGNILVTKVGEPKILDFGVARATDSDIQTTTLQTDIGQLIGTVPYMSPEQAGGNPDDLDTRSDVYALGVVAYEMLANRLPYALQEKMIHEAVRVIREDEPTPLSSTNRSLRGDVKIVIGKALEKDKGRRYQSALDFASDVERYLNHEPIVARPPSAAYQFRKFAHRNKTLVSGAVAVFVVLMTGLIGMSILYVQAEDARAAEAEQRRIAEASAREAVEAREEADEARQAEADRADELELVASFQESQFAEIETELLGIHLRTGIIDKRRAFLVGRGMAEQEIEEALSELEWSLAGVNFTNVALEALDENIFDRAIAAIHEQLDEQPLIKARLLQTVANTLLQLGLYERAAAPQAEALDLRRHMLGDQHRDTIQSIRQTGTLLRRQGEYATAEQYFREALNHARHVLGDDHPKTIRILNYLGVLHRQQGNLVEAEEYLQQAIAESRRVLGDDHRDTLSAINNLGGLRHYQGKPEEAEPYYREVLAGFRRTLGDDHPDTLYMINNMGALLRTQGKLDEAETYLREALDGRRRVLGDGHPNTLLSINSMAVLLFHQGRQEDATAYVREALDGFRQNLGNDHPYTLNALSNVGVMLQRQGKLAEAVPHLRDAIETRRRTLGDDHPDTLNSINSKAVLLQQMGKFAEAEVLHREALKGRRRVLGNEHPRTLTSMNNMGVVLGQQEKLDEAEPYLKEALAIRRELHGDEHLSVVISVNSMGKLLWRQGKHEEAIPYYREVLKGFRRIYGEEHERTITAMSDLVDVLHTVEQFSEAEELAIEYAQLKLEHFGDDDERTHDAVTLLVDIYEDWHEHEPDAGHEKSAKQWRAKLPEASPNHN